MENKKEEFIDTFVVDCGSNIQKKVNVNEYQKKNIDSLNIVQQWRLKGKIGKELENYLFDMCSSKLKKQKEQFEHLMVLELDIAKKRLTNDYYNALAMIESDLTKTIDAMLKENMKTTSVSLDSLFELCDNMKENAKKYEEKSPSRYKRMMEEIEEREKNGWDLIMLRSKELIDKHQQIFEKTTKLLSETKEKYE